MKLDGGEFYQNVPFNSDFGHDGIRITGTCMCNRLLEFSLLIGTGMKTVLEKCYTEKLNILCLCPRHN